MTILNPKNPSEQLPEEVKFNQLSCVPAALNMIADHVSTVVDDYGDVGEYFDQVDAKVELFRACTDCCHFTFAFTVHASNEFGSYASTILINSGIALNCDNCFTDTLDSIAECLDCNDFAMNQVPGFSPMTVCDFEMLKDFLVEEFYNFGATEEEDNLCCLAMSYASQELYKSNDSKDLS